MAGERIWIIEPSASAGDPVWQGREIFELAVRAETPAFARIIADRWAGAVSLIADRRPGFEDEKLYHVAEAPENLDLDRGSLVRMLGEPTPSTGSANEVPIATGERAGQPLEGKTTTTGAPENDVDDFPGASAIGIRDWD